MTMDLGERGSVGMDCLGQDKDLFRTLMSTRMSLGTA
jgi:hypothetical protein